ncbi:hypothetical protein HMPREF3108_01125 [Streptococcus sp. HMSC10A01]|nr:hypothetical protein HMPREF3108_01125 [Streptococcus sp. HMSC10A01]
MFIFLLFYIGMAQSFQPTYYSGFKPFFQLSRKDKKSPFRAILSILSIKFPLKPDNETTKEENCKE